MELRIKYSEQQKVLNHRNNIYCNDNSESKNIRAKLEKYYHQATIFIIQIIHKLAYHSFKAKRQVIAI